MHQEPSPPYVQYPRDYGRGLIGPGPGRIRFEAIAEAWRVVLVDWGIWVCSSLILMAVGLALATPAIIAQFARIGSGDTGTTEYGTPTWGAFGIAALTTCLSHAVLGVLAAGLMSGALTKVRTGQLAFSNLFDFRGRFGQVVAAECVLCPIAIVPLASGTAAAMLFGSSANPLVLPWILLGGECLGWIVNGIVYALLSFTPLLIIDKGLSVGEAYSTSYRTLKSKVVLMCCVLWTVGLASGLGACACGIGILLTGSLSYICRAIIYHDFFRPAPPVTPAGPNYGATYPSFDASQPNMQEPPTL